MGITEKLLQKNGPEEAMMKEPKKLWIELWIGADWKAERDHYGLDNRCGMFSTERFNEDDKGYVPADLTDALVEATEDLIEAARAALAALKAMEG